MLGGIDAAVASWSDAWVQDTVASSAISGAAKVQQNGAWSNAKSFIVLPPSGSALTLSPTLFNLVVGESRSIQALDVAGTELSGLTWISESDMAVVTVSTDPSPLITAVAPGTASIRAVGASAEVTVFAGGGMPEERCCGSTPGPMPGVSDIKVAVPAPGSVAKVFAIGNQGEVQAIGSDGKVAWTVPAPIASYYESRPGFQGGLVVFRDDTIVRLDPGTGQPTTLDGNANDTRDLGSAVAQRRPQMGHHAPTGEGSQRPKAELSRAPIARFGRWRRTPRPSSSPWRKSSHRLDRQ